MRKLYRSHQFITPPDANGISYFGLSDFAVKYFIRFHKLNTQAYQKTNYMIRNRLVILNFLKQTNQSYKQKKLPLAEQMEYKKILIKKDQGFAIMQTYEFDVQLTAPVKLTVLQSNYDADYFHKYISAQYLFKVRVFQEQDLKQLMTEQQYNKSQKYFQYA